MLKLRCGARWFQTASRQLSQAASEVPKPAEPQPEVSAAPPKVVSSSYIFPQLNKPIPLNVEMNYYEPFRHAETHGDLVAKVKFSSYDPRKVELYVDFAMRAAYYLGIPVHGAVHLRTKLKKWTVIRSPFAQAKSKEQFEKPEHRKVLNAFDATPEVVDLWVSYLHKHNELEGLDIRVDTFHRQPVGFVKQLDALEIEQQDRKAVEESASDAVLARVQELLAEPVFQRHFSGQAEGSPAKQAAKPAGDAKAAKTDKQPASEAQHATKSAQATQRAPKEAADKTAKPQPK